MSYLATYKQSTLDPPPPGGQSPAPAPPPLRSPTSPLSRISNCSPPPQRLHRQKKKHHLQSFLTPIQSPQTAFRRPKTEPDCCAMG